MYSTASGRNHDTQQRPCRYGLRTNCPFGDRCKFEHEPHEETNLDPIAVVQGSSNLGQGGRNLSSGRQAGTRRSSNNATGRGGKANQKIGRNVGAENSRNKGKGAVRGAGSKEAPNGIAARAAKELAIQRANEATEAIKREIEQERLEREMWEAKIAKEQVDTERLQERLRQEREQEATVQINFFASESSLITCGAGLDVQHVIPGFELCQITIKNLPADAKKSEVEDVFVQQGISKSEFFLISLKKEARKANQEAVILAKAEHGEVIAAGLEGNEFRDSILTFEVTQNTNFHSDSMGSSSKSHTALTVWWYEPSTTVKATYDNAEAAADHQRRMNQQLFRGRRIRAIVDQARRVGTFNPYLPTQASVRIYNLPAHTTINDALIEFSGTNRMQVLFSTSSLTNPRDTLRALIQPHQGIRIDTLRDIPQDATKGECKIEVQFDSWEDAKESYDFLEKRKIGATKFRCWLPRPLQYEIRITKEQYEAQKGSWDELSGRREGSEAFVQIRIPGGPHQPHVFVRALGDNKKTVGALKVRVENLASGRKLDTQTYWHSSFASFRGNPFFQRIKRETGVLVRNDFKTNSLKVFGDPNRLDDACRMLKEEADRLRGEEVTIRIEPWMVRFFVNKGLQELQELLGEDQVRLDVTAHRIIVKGGDEATQHADRLIREARTIGRAAAASTSGGNGDAACVVCTDTASHPELLVCGHTYCKACLQHFIVSAVDGTSFPIKCVGEDNRCHRPISIPVIRRFLTPGTFDGLVEAVFKVYMEKHSDEFKYCTTADCKQIYRHGGDDDVQCPSCFATFCPKCDEPHEDMTCAQWRAHKDPDGEHEGLGSLGYKKCPSCKIWTSKTEGCNHMTCGKCTAHFCWLCLAVFPSGGEVYQHMTDAHGGYWANGDQQQGAAGAQGADGILGALRPADYDQQRQELLRIQQERDRRERVQQAEVRRRVEQGLEEARLQRLRVEAARQQLEEERLQRLRMEAARQRMEANQRRLEVERFEQQRALSEARERRQAAERQRKEEEGGWCIVM